MMNIVVLGAGRLGSVMAQVLKNNANVELWDQAPGLVENQKNIADIIPSADFVFLCIPSWFLRSALQGIKKYLNKKTVIVSMSKGIEAGSLKTVNQILEEELLEGQKVAFIGGPMMAEEIAQGLGGVGVVAVEDSTVFADLDKLFDGPHIYLEHSFDIKSVVLAGVLKNIYSVGLGIASGLEWGGNFKGWLTVQTIRETKIIMELFGRDPDSIIGLAGIGDIITTGFSKYSSNYKSGKEIVTKGVSTIKSEGLVSLPSLLELIGENTQNLHFLAILKRTLIDKEDVKAIFTAFRPDNL